MNREPRCVVVCLARRGGVIVQGCDVYIGRAVNRGGWNLEESKWRNPFTINSCKGNVGEAIKKFESYLLSNPKLLACLPELRGKTLGCWCKKTPASPCHGDILAKLVNKLPKEQKNSTM